MFTCTDAGLLDTSTDGRTIITAAYFWELFLTKALQYPDPNVPTYLKRATILKPIMVSFLGCLPSKWSEVKKYFTLAASERCSTKSYPLVVSQNTLHAVPLNVTRSYFATLNFN